jgi:hypothetical protein
VGTNLTVAATLEVSRLTGLLIYFRHYRVDVSVFVGGKLAARAQNVSDPLSAPLFQGGHWGPQNLVMSVSENSFGIRPGETLPANISLSFVGDVYHDFPVSNYTPESGSRTIGSVSIVDPPAVGGEPNTSTFLVPVFVVNFRITFHSDFCWPGQIPLDDWEEREEISAHASKLIENCRRKRGLLDVLPVEEHDCDDQWNLDPESESHAKNRG